MIFAIPNFFREYSLARILQIFAIPDISIYQIIFEDYYSLLKCIARIWDDFLESLYHLLILGGRYLAEDDVANWEIGDPLVFGPDWPLKAGWVLSFEEILWIENSNFAQKKLALWHISLASSKFILFASIPSSDQYKNSHPQIFHHVSTSPQLPNCV